MVPVLLLALVPMLDPLELKNFKKYRLKQAHALIHGTCWDLINKMQFCCVFIIKDAAEGNNDSQPFDVIVFKNEPAYAV